MAKAFPVFALVFGLISAPAIISACDKPGCCGYHDLKGVECRDNLLANKDCRNHGSDWYELGRHGTSSGTREACVRDCKKGQYSGSNSRYCYNCPAGSSSPSKSAKCTQCKEGEYNNDSGGLCRPCQPGYFSSTLGSIECSVCKAGTYSNAEKSSKCTTCPAGTESKDGAASCSSCDQGYDSAPGGICHDINECERGTHSCPSNSKCINEAGSYTCKCNEGYYVDGSENDQIARVPMECAEKVLIFEVSGKTSTSFTFSTKSNIPLPNVRIDAKRVNPFDENLWEEFGRDSIASKLVTPAQLNSDGVSYVNLRPGTKLVLVAHAIRPDGSEDESYRTIEKVQLPCNCPGKSTEAPSDFVVEQKNGFVNFFFLDNSLCADTFIFKRFKVDKNDTQQSAKTPLASQYNIFKSGNDVCQSSAQLVSPGREARDDIAQSNLEVGERYQYELSIKSSITGITYPEPVFSEIHTVQWEASIAGVVTTNPEYGAYPVENVNIECTLLELGVTIAAVTDKAGKYECVFGDTDNYGHHFTDSGEYSVGISFSKSTPINVNTTNASEVPHTFLCREGSQDCTNDPLIVPIRHLELNKPVVTYDDSALPITGRVSIAQTESIAQPEGCPLSNVQICLTQYTQKSWRDTDVCTVTNSRGEYTILASLQTRVGLRASYNQHELVPDGNTIWVDNGIQILEDWDYEGFNFKDVEKANVTVEVGGGICGIDLGRTTLEYKIQGCLSDPETLEHVGFRNQFEVPAHALKFEIGNIQNRDRISEYFDGVQQLVDLTDLSQQDEEKRKVVFQYEGSPKITPKFYKITANNYLQQPKPQTDKCDKMPFQGETSYDKSYSFHVLEDKTYYLLSAEIEMHIDDDLPLCDRLPEGTNFTIENRLGYSQGTLQSDIDALEKDLKDNAVAKSVIAVLGRCNNGCSLPVLALGQSQLRLFQQANAQVELDLLTGYPNFSNDFSRILTISSDGLQNNIVHTCNVVVEGTKVYEKLGSFALPQTNPIMVLRDPPGSQSYAYYKNIETKIELVHKHQDRSRKWNSDLIVGAYGKSETTASAFGFGTTLVDIEARSGNIIESSKNNIYDYNDNIYSGKLTATWSYETSQEVWTAGRSSDIFVVPSLNVVYNENENLEWDASNCIARKTTQTEFDVENTEANTEMFSFVSHYFITREEIPRLEAKLAEKLAGKDKSDKLQEEIGMLNSSLYQWNRVIESHNETNLAAKERDMDKLLDAGTYVDEKVVKELPEQIRYFFEGYTRPFAPTTLTPAYLEDRRSFKFDGGGSQLKYELSHEALVSESKKHGSQAENQDLTNADGFGVSFRAGAPLGIAAALIHTGIDGRAAVLRHKEAKDKRNELGRRLETETIPEIDERELNRRRELLQAEFESLSINIEHNLKLKQESSITESTMGFVLGDEDSGDYFDIDVFIDKKYGSFVFHTISGQSKCPVEAGTTAREKPFIEITEKPNGPVLPDEEMIFKVLLQNQGIDLTSLQISQDLRTNTDGLSVSVNSQTLSRPVQIEEILGGEGYEALLTVSRGPKLYEYPPITLIFRSTCEYTRNFGDGNSIALSDGESALMKINVSNAWDSEGQPIIKFERPCPEIIWSDSLEATRSAEKGFILNLDTYEDVFKIVIRNPNRNLYKLADIDRLKEISVWYRRLGVGSWTRAQDPEGNSINMKTLDEDFGYIQAYWDIKSLFDGQYEVYVQCDCERSSRFSESAKTKSLMIVQDTKRPQLYGIPRPFEVITPNTPVIFEFTEPIQCLEPYSFEVRAIIEGSNAFYDKNNLAVLCEGRTVHVSFEKTFRWENVMGRNLVVNIQNVADLNGNFLLQETISHQLRFPSVTSDSVVLQFNLRLQTDCLTVKNEINVTKILAEEVAKLLQVDPSRVIVVGVQCERAGLLVGKVSVLPAVSEQGRRLLNDNDDPSYLLDMLSKGLIEAAAVGEESLLSNATLDTESVVVTTQAASSEEHGTASLVYTPESPAMQMLMENQRSMNQASQEMKEISQSQESSKEKLNRLETILVGLSASLVAIVVGIIGGFLILYKQRSTKDSNNEQWSSKHYSAESINPTFDT